MTSPRTSLRVATAAAVGAAAVLAACGGGDNNNYPAPPTSGVPLSASESPSGFIAYLQLLVHSDADTLEPVDTSMVAGPIDDTSEPTPVD